MATILDRAIEWWSPGRGLVRRRRVAQHLEHQPAGQRRRLSQAHLHLHAQWPARAGALADQGMGAVVVDEILTA